MKKSYFARLVSVLSAGRSFVRRLAILLLLCILPFTGCRKTGTNEHHDHGGDGHSHAEAGAQETEEKTAQITIWSDRYEIFAEHKAVAVGKASEFITHVSEIVTGEPRRAGPIRFVLEQGNSKFEHAEPSPVRPGIYLPAITFPAEGDWKASVLISGEPEAVVPLGTIKVFANAESAAKAGLPEAPEGISFLKEQQWRIRAKSRPVSKQTLIERLPLKATVIPAPGSKSIVFSTVTGILLDGDQSKLGSSVKAGEVLAWVQPTFGEFTTKLVEAEADAIRTKAAFEQAETLFQRTKGLFEQQAKSERELREADVALRTARASYEAAAAVQNLYKKTGATLEGNAVKLAITAPIDGFLDRVYATPGTRVTPEEPVFAIVNPRTAFIEAHVPETRFPRIDPKIGAMFVPAGNTNFFELKLVALGREVDQATRTIPVTFAFASQEQTLPLGSAGTLLMGTGKAVEAVAVPSEAIIEDDGVPVVFVHVSGETYQKRDVSLGFRDGNWIEIKSGVNEGERVATDGAYAILLSTKSGTIPAHGHAH